ncbi:hypothetical protein JK358_34860 [Nocardia sp. 2]|uniref:Immunity protein 50 of polymorphic toxin system n=1 Tax=Nocardia acididurans TaxID=2802282 RepID=A0ABS1MK23_9NOCA|nr:hypothetical protein [Nocardia acididurans]MBL1079598.1 hypothetical protein [Nocardia acididurans]
MRIESLLVDANNRVPAQVQWNPLLVEDLLLEACVLDFRYVPQTSSVGVLLDLRTALQIDEGNTGLLIVENTLKMAISIDKPHGAMVSTIVGSVPDTDTPATYGIEIACMPAAVITIAGQRALFHVGNVDGIGDAQPMLEGEEFPTEGFQRWESDIALVYTTDSLSRS